MDKYTLQEQAFKRGYDKGYREGKAAGFEVGHNQGYADAIEDMPGTGAWKWDKDGNLICSNCGMLEPDSLPGACVIWPQEKRYCFYCGTRLLRPEEL